MEQKYIYTRRRASPRCISYSALNLQKNGQTKKATCSWTQTKFRRNSRWDSGIAASKPTMTVIANQLHEYTDRRKEPYTVMSHP